MTASLHVVDFILNILFLHCGYSEVLVYYFISSKQWYSENLSYSKKQWEQGEAQTKGWKNNVWKARTLPRRQRPQRHQQSRHRSPDLVNLNLRSLCLRCREVGLGTIRMRAFKSPSVDYQLEHLKARRRRREQWICESRDPRDEHDPSEEVPIDNKPSESAPSASDHPAPPSPTTTTLPATHPATSSPTTTPPMTEGLGFTGMPYATYGVNPVATAPPMATAVSEPVSSSFTYTGIHDPAPLRYAEGYHRPPAGVGPTHIPDYAAPEPGYAMPPSGLASLSGLGGPDSCGGRSMGSGRSSNRSLTRSEIKEALHSATGELVADMTQEIRIILKPLIPSEGSSMAIGASPYPVQASHVVAGLTHTLGGVRSRPMPTPAAVPRSASVPRTTQPPYSHVENSTQAELDQLALTALRLMVGVEPYCSSYLGRDLSDDEPPFLTFASPSEDDDPEDPKNPSGTKKKKRRRSKRDETRRSKEAKAITTSKIVVNQPEFTGKDHSEFAESFGRIWRMTGQTHASGRVKCDRLLQCCKTNCLQKQVKQIVRSLLGSSNFWLPLRGSTPPTRPTYPSGPRSRTRPCCPPTPRLRVSLNYWQTWTTG